MKSPSVKAMALCDSVLKLANLSGAFCLIGMVYILEKEDLYPLYLQSTASASILYLLILSGFGPLVSRSLSLELMARYLRRVMGAWLIVSFIMVVFFLLLNDKEYLNVYLIFSSVLLSSALSVPWALHILPSSSILIVAVRIVFWLGLFLSFFKSNFWILYVSVTLSCALQAKIMWGDCGRLGQRNVYTNPEKLDVSNLYSFRVKEIGARLNENLCNYLAAFILPGASLMLFHAVMKSCSIGASFLYIPVRANLRGGDELDYLSKYAIKYALPSFSAVLGGWFVFTIIADPIITSLSKKFVFMELDKMLSFAHFFSQPVLLVVLASVFVHVYMKAKKDIFAWPLVFMRIEITGIIMSVFYGCFIWAYQDLLSVLTMILSHFVFSASRDYIVYFGYKKFKSP